MCSPFLESHMRGMGLRAQVDLLGVRVRVRARVRVSVRVRARVTVRV